MRGRLLSTNPNGVYTYEIHLPLGFIMKKQMTDIMAPWNYPVQLLLNPLVGAISAGCTAVLKPSPYVPNTSKVLEEMIKETFRPEYIAVVQGNREAFSATSNATRPSRV